MCLRNSGRAFSRFFDSTPSSARAMATSGTACPFTTAALPVGRTGGAAGTLGATASALAGGALSLAGAVPVGLVWARRELAATASDRSASWETFVIEATSAFRRGPASRVEHHRVQAIGMGYSDAADLRRDESDH